MTGMDYTIIKQMQRQMVAMQLHFETTVAALTSQMEDIRRQRSSPTSLKVSKIPPTMEQKPASYWNHQRRQKQQHEASKGSHFGQNSAISRWAYLVARISDPSQVLGSDCCDAGRVFPREQCPTFKSLQTLDGNDEDLLDSCKV